MLKKTDILEYLQCMVNTETTTPLFVVKKMLDLIPTSIYLDDTKTFLCPCCKDGIFLREIALKILKLKYDLLGQEQFEKQKTNLLNHILQKRLFGIAISYRGYRVTKRTLYGVNKNINIDDINSSNIYFNEEYGKYMQDKLGIKSEKQSFHFITEDKTESNELTNFFKNKGVENMKFDVVIGNPPYQMKAGGKSHQLYLQFFKQSFSLADLSIMIFPNGWLKASGRGSGMTLAPEMRENKNIQSIDVYYEDKNINDLVIFPNVEIGAVNIVVYNSDYNNNGLVDYYEYGEYKGKKDITKIKEKNEIDENILQKINKIKFENYFDSVVSGWNPFGVQSSLLANPEKYGFSQFIISESENLSENPKERERERCSYFRC